MPSIYEIQPEILKNRHRLSSQQINSLYGRSVFQENLEEKFSAFEQVREFLLITDAMRSAGISFIPLKGPVLSFRIYNDPTFRQFRDLDILINIGSIDKSFKVLEESGYKINDLYWPGNGFGKKVWINTHHDVTFVHPEKSTLIELHWSLLGTHGVNLSHVESIIKKNNTEVQFAGSQFTVLSDELELLYLIIHGGLHSWARLKWLYDVNYFLKINNIDWDCFFRLSNELNAGRLIALFNKVQREYFPEGPDIPEFSYIPSYMVRYTKNMISAADYTSPESLASVCRGIRFTLISFPGVKFKLKSIFNYILSSIFFGRIGAIPGKLHIFITDIFKGRFKHQ